MYSAKHIIYILNYKEFDKNNKPKKQIKLLEVWVNIYHYCHVVKKTVAKKFVLNQKYFKSGKSVPTWPDPRPV